MTEKLHIRGIVMSKLQKNVKFSSSTANLCHRTYTNRLTQRPSINARAFFIALIGANPKSHLKHATVKIRLVVIV